MSIQATDEQLKSLAKLSQKLSELKSESEDIEKVLKEYQQDIQELEMQAIPDLMSEIGVASITLTDGTKVQVKPFVAASITKAHEEEAFQWLRDNGYGDLIKERTVVNVHPSTLKAWAKERVEVGESIPDNLFSLFVGSKATVK